MNRIAKSFALLTAAAATLVAAGCKDGPTAPEPVTLPPPVEVKTPVSAEITSISVARFPENKTNGSTWDASLIAAARRPDLYVSLVAEGTIPDFVSSVATDAETGTIYTFTNPYSIYDGRLPVVVPHGTSRRIYVMDHDVGGDHDRLGWITVNLPKAYSGDNARSLDYTFIDSGNRLAVRVRGTWNY